MSPNTPNTPAKLTATAPVARGAAALELEAPAAVPVPVAPAAVPVPVVFAVVAVVPTTAAPVLLQTPIENPEGVPVGAVYPEVKEASAAECSFDQLAMADS
jgi:hypothetical protein